MKLSSLVLSTNVTQVCFSQCLIACLKIALWVPEKEIQEQQTVKVWLSGKSHVDFVWIEEESIISVDTSRNLGPTFNYSANLLYHPYA